MFARDLIAKQLVRLWEDPEWESGEYHILNVESGTAVTMKPEETEPRRGMSYITHTKLNGSSNQVFSIQDDTRYDDSCGAAYQVTCKLWGSKWMANGWHMFTFMDVGGGQYRIQSAKDRTSVELNRNNVVPTNRYNPPESGLVQNICTGEWHGGPSQLWVIVSVQEAKRVQEAERVQLSRHSPAASRRGCW